jgi:hypothetical protein
MLFEADKQKKADGKCFQLMVVFENLKHSEYRKASNRRPLLFEGPLLKGSHKGDQGKNFQNFEVEK